MVVLLADVQGPHLLLNCAGCRHRSGTTGKLTRRLTARLQNCIPHRPAYGLRTEDGLDLLIGMDTVELDGKHSRKLRLRGDTVKRGDVITISIFPYQGGRLLATPMVITNAKKAAASVRMSRLRAHLSPAQIHSEGCTENQR